MGTREEEGTRIVWKRRLWRDYFNRILKKRRENEKREGRQFAHSCAEFFYKKCSFCTYLEGAWCCTQMSCTEGMHKLSMIFIKKYYFIKKFDQSHIDKQDKGTTIIYRNYNKEVDVNIILKLKN